jgi:hypothetical protein
MGIWECGLNSCGSGRDQWRRLTFRFKSPASMLHDVSWKVNIYSAVQQILLLWNPKIRWRFTRRLTLSWSSIIHSIPSHPIFLRSISILSSDLLVHFPLISPMCDTCPDYHILLNSIILILFEEYELWICSYATFFMLLLLLQNSTSKKITYFRNNLYTCTLLHQL